jgi:hypothetical protein
VCAVLLTVEDDEEHVSRSECAVPISAVGNNCQGVCTPGPALTDQFLTNSSLIKYRSNSLGWW